MEFQWFSILKHLLLRLFGGGPDWGWHISRRFWIGQRREFNKCGWIMINVAQKLENSMNMQILIDYPIVCVPTMSHKYVSWEIRHPSILVSNYTLYDDTSWGSLPSESPVLHGGGCLLTRRWLKHIGNTHKKQKTFRENWLTIFFSKPKKGHPPKKKQLWPFMLDTSRPYGFRTAASL